MCNWNIILLAEIWSLFVFKKYLFTLGKHVRKPFQSGKKIILVSCILIKAIVFSLNLVSDLNLMAQQDFQLR